MTLQQRTDTLDIQALLVGAPFGGYKASGFGRTVSAESILDYTQVTSVIIEGRV
jgi:acyl-CoA reductase-like NAD-dependent aldehyde dehydrogenase